MKFKTVRELETVSGMIFRKIKENAETYNESIKKKNKALFGKVKMGKYGTKYRRYITLSKMRCEIDDEMSEITKFLCDTTPELRWGSDISEKSYEKHMNKFFEHELGDKLKQVPDSLRRTIEEDLIVSDIEGLDELIKTLVTKYSE